MEKTLNESISKIRVDLQNSKIKKTGKNKFAGFDYFELADFLPTLNEMLSKEKINDIFTIEDGYATLKLVRGEEENIYKIPFVIFDTPEKNAVDKVTGEIERVKMMQDIQYLGALNTYYKRYLYINAFGITDGEIIDNLDITSSDEKKSKKSQKNDIAEIDYKIALRDELVKKNINIPTYAKKHELGANTSQKQAYMLYTRVKNSTKEEIEAELGENNGNKS